MNGDTETGDYRLDDVDRGVLNALQRDARHTTAKEIAAAVEVSPSTVRNRIANMEDRGIIVGYRPVVDYERAGYPLRVLFVAATATGERSRVAERLSAVDGVVEVRETVTGRRNLVVEVVAPNTRTLDETVGELDALPLDLLEADVVVGHHLVSVEEER